MQPIDVLTTAEAAEALAVDVRTVHRMISAGRLAAQKLPGLRGAYLIDPASVAALTGPTDAGSTHDREVPTT